MIKNLYILYLICLTIIVNSCGSSHNSSESASVLQQCTSGGASRANNFMIVADKFSAETAIFEQFPVADSLGLSSLLPIDEVNVAFATESGYIGIGNSSNIQWITQIFHNKGYIASGMCRDKSGNLYAVSTSGYMSAIDPLGKLIWKKKLLHANKGSIIWLDLLSVSDGIVACGDTSIFKVGFDGKVIWRQDRSSTPIGNISADAHGNLYSAQSINIPGGTDTLVCWNPEGKLRWKATLPFIRLTTQPLILNGKVFVGGVRIDQQAKTPALFCFGDDGTKCWETIIKETPRFLSADDSMLYLVCSEPRISEQARSMITGFTLDGHKKWHVYVSAKAAAPLLISKSNVGMLAKHQESASDFFIFNKSGVLESQFSFADQGNSSRADFLPLPAVLRGGSIAFPCSDKSGIVAVQAKKGFLF